jgi:hypothetical protein
MKKPGTKSSKRDTANKNVPVRTALKAGSAQDQVVFVQPPAMNYWDW